MSNFVGGGGGAHQVIIDTRYFIRVKDHSSLQTEYYSVSAVHWNMITPKIINDHHPVCTVQYVLVAQQGSRLLQIMGTSRYSNE